MAVITRYVLVDRHDNEDGYEYDSYQAALDDCDEHHAIVERQYEYTDSELVYTPNGSDSWPPKAATRTK